MKDEIQNDIETIQSIRAFKSIKNFSKNPNIFKLFFKLFPNNIYKY